MRIRLWLGLLSIALVMAFHPSAHASRRPATPVKKVAATSSAGKTTATPRVKPTRNGFKRKPGAHETTREPAVDQQTAHTARPSRSRPSVAHNVGWGAFFATLGTASAVQGSVLGAVVGAAATAYNGVKAWLVARRGATVAQAQSIAFNAGWGTFWGGVGVHGLAAGDPLAAAIGLGAGAYNLYKAGRNTRALPGTGE